jgi:hypothetical protein
LRAAKQVGTAEGIFGSLRSAIELEVAMIPVGEEMVLFPCSRQIFALRYSYLSELLGAGLGCSKGIGDLRLEILLRLLLLSHIIFLIKLIWIA